MKTTRSWSVLEGGLSAGNHHRLLILMGREMKAMVVVMDEILFAGKLPKGRRMVLNRVMQLRWSKHAPMGYFVVSVCLML